MLCAWGHTHTHTHTHTHSQTPNCGFFVCLIAWLEVSPLSLCRLLSPSAHWLLRHSSTSNTLIHTRFRMTTQMHKQDFQPWLAHAHKTRSLTHSGIIVVVKLERRSERDEERGRGTSTGGGAEGGKRGAIAPAKVFYPQAVFKRLPCPWPSHEDKPLFSPIAASARPMLDIKVAVVIYLKWKPAFVDAESILFTPCAEIRIKLEVHSQVCSVSDVRKNLFVLLVQPKVDF